MVTGSLFVFTVQFLKWHREYFESQNEQLYDSETELPDGAVILAPFVDYASDDVYYTYMVARKLTPHRIIKNRIKSY